LKRDKLPNQRSWPLRGLKIIKSYRILQQRR
jgi:hypothetical protein